MDDSGDFLSIIGFICLAVVVVFGFVKFINYLDADSLKTNTAKCEQLAKLSNVKEYKLGDYKCYLLKDNKIEEVKL